MDKTITTAAEAFGMTNKQVKEALEMGVTTPNKTELTDEQIETLRGWTPAEEPAEAPVNSKAKAPKVATFFWREGKNLTFNVNGKFYKTIKSTIRLDADEDRDAIAWLKSRPGFEENGGKDFSEFGSEDVSDEAEFMDKLLGLSRDTLIQMAGGTVADSRLTQGRLIVKILAEQGFDS